MRPSLLIAIVIVGACQPRNVTDAPEPPAPPTIRFERDMMIRFHMHQEFDLVRAIERLLVRGQLDDAKSLARSLGKSPDEAGLAPWAAQVTRVRERAAAIATAVSVDDAIRRTAALGEACASCHVDAGVVPEFRSPPRLPADRPTVEARMARHLWAANRLWEGAVGGADEPWIAGLEVLAATPLPVGELGSDRAALARQVQRQAETARKQRATDTLADRARVYGEILVTCAACHAAPAAKP